MIDPIASAAGGADETEAQVADDQRCLDRRQRRLVDAAARAAWPGKKEPQIKEWW
jgi:hypothetical protein